MSSIYISVCTMQEQRQNCLLQYISLWRKVTIYGWFYEIYWRQETGMHIYFQWTCLWKIGSVSWIINRILYCGIRPNTLLWWFREKHEEEEERRIERKEEEQGSEGRVVNLVNDDDDESGENKEGQQPCEELVNHPRSRVALGHVLKRFVL